MNVLKGQNLPIINAVMVSLTLHVLAGWAFLNIARDLSHYNVVTPVEFFVVPPPPPERVLPAAPRTLTKPAQTNVAPVRSRLVPPPTVVAATRPISESPVVPGPLKQKVEASPSPLPAPPIAVSPRAREAASFHSAPASAAATTAPVASGTTAVSRSATLGNNDAGTFTGPSYGAAYLHNPTPPYPYAAKKLRLQGTAVVRVFVSPEGQPKNVLLEKTSGVGVLDETALETVKHWMFVPARRGNTCVADWVDVPIKFRLN